MLYTITAIHGLCKTNAVRFLIWFVIKQVGKFCSHKLMQKPANIDFVQLYKIFYNIIIFQYSTMTFDQCIAV